MRVPVTTPTWQAISGQRTGGIRPEDSDTPAPPPLWPARAGRSPGPTTIRIHRLEVRRHVERDGHLEARIARVVAEDEDARAVYARRQAGRIDRDRDGFRGARRERPAGRVLPQPWDIDDRLE